jgi:succinyl-diaminopimelate desuccinylase
MGPASLASTDLLELTAALVDVPSVSFDERRLADLLEAELRTLPGLEVTRVGDNVVARTLLDRPARLVLAGHTDTVPAQGNDRAVVDGECLRGLGASDMKGALAVFVQLARTMGEPPIDVTFVFYAREEVAAAHSGLEELFVARPDLLVGDAAILGEPTSSVVEAGCQGTLRLRVTLRGARAHTARPWMGRNAIHRLAPVLTAVADHVPRRPVIDGLEFREALQAVSVEGGVAGNVVPDEAKLLLNVRFAPDRRADEAAGAVRELLRPHLEDGDLVELVDAAEAAPPAIGHPLLAPLVDELGLAVNPKLGWTDVARFTSRGVPAVNVGPGDPTLAHTADEHVERADLERAFEVLHHVLHRPAAGAAGDGLLRADAAR